MSAVDKVGEPWNASAREDDTARLFHAEQQTVHHTKLANALGRAHCLDMQTTQRPGQIETDLMQQLVDLVDYDMCPRIELDGPNGHVGIWSDDDILGSGETTSEAIADAILTVRAWR